MSFSSFIECSSEKILTNSQLQAVIKAFKSYNSCMETERGNFNKSRHNKTANIDSISYYVKHRDKEKAHMDPINTIAVLYFHGSCKNIHNGIQCTHSVCLSAFYVPVRLWYLASLRMILQICNYVFQHLGSGSFLHAGKFGGRVRCTFSIHYFR